MKPGIFVASLLATLAGCTYPAVQPPGPDHPANIDTAAGLLPEFALEDDSPLGGESDARTRVEQPDAHRHHRH